MNEDERSHFFYAYCLNNRSNTDADTDVLFSIDDDTDMHQYKYDKYTHKQKGLSDMLTLYTRVHSQYSCFGFR